MDERDDLHLQRGDSPAQWRAKFAEFLDRLARGSATRSHWEEFVITQYPDELLEGIRRDCVRLLLGRGANESPTEPERQQLRSWSLRLRESIPTAPQRRMPPSNDA
jgi:hypothetical protein